MKWNLFTYLNEKSPHSRGRRKGKKKLGPLELSSAHVFKLLLKNREIKSKWACKVWRNDTYTKSKKLKERKRIDVRRARVPRRFKREFQRKREKKEIIWLLSVPGRRSASGCPRAASNGRGRRDGLTPRAPTGTFRYVWEKSCKAPGKLCFPGPRLTYYSVNFSWTAALLDVV